MSNQKISKNGVLYGQKPWYWFDTQEAWERNQAQTDYERTNRTGVFAGVDSVLGSAGKVMNNVSDSVSFTAWLNEHWRLAIIGVISIVLLLKD